MNTRTLWIAAVAVLSFVLPARGDEIIELDRSAVVIDDYGRVREAEPRVLTTISTETGVPVEVLRTQRSQSRLGYGELLIANSLASATGRTFDEIVARRTSGEGWGRIAKDYNVKLGPIVSRAHHAGEALGDVKGKKVKKVKKAKGHDEGEIGEGHGVGNGHGNMGHGNKGHGHGK
jgi:hypothetical protein